MSARQKAGVGFIVSGAVSATVGIVTMMTTQDPGWLNIILTILGFALPALGLTVNLPKLP